MLLQHGAGEELLKIKWTDKITNDEVFQRAIGEKLLVKILKNRSHSWIGHTIRHDVCL